VKQVGAVDIFVRSKMNNFSSLTQSHIDRMFRFHSASLRQAVVSVHHAVIMAVRKIAQLFHIAVQSIHNIQTNQFTRNAQADAHYCPNRISALQYSM
jgi:hypothetical protein